MSSPNQEAPGDSGTEPGDGCVPPADNRAKRPLNPTAMPRLGLSVGIVSIAIGAALVILIIPIPGPASVKTIALNAAINAGLSVLGGGGGLGLFIANVLTLVIGAGLVAVGALLVSPSWKELRRRRREKLLERARIAREKGAEVLERGRDAGRGAAAQGRNAAQAIGRTSTRGVGKVSDSARRTRETIKARKFGDQVGKGLSSVAGLGMRMVRRKKTEAQLGNQTGIARPTDKSQGDLVKDVESSTEVGGSVLTPKESKK